MAANEWEEINIMPDKSYSSPNTYSISSASSIAFSRTLRSSVTISELKKELREEILKELKHEGHLEGESSLKELTRKVASYV